MKINNWKKFNENNISEDFTEEMAQEIVYCFSDGSYLKGNLIESSKKFWKLLEDFNQHRSFIMYDASYSDMKEMVEKLYNLCQKEDPTFKSNMIDIYHGIRKEKENFPHIYEIEDLFLNFIEVENFRFYINFREDESVSYYQIKLLSGKFTYDMNYYNKLCNDISNLIERFGHPNEIYVKQSKYYFYEFDSGKKGGGIDFEIKMK